MKRKADEIEEAENKVPKKNTETKGSWDDLSLDKRLLQALAQQSWHAPTPVQAKAIPVALGGQDLLARSKTGSGKSAAFLLPVLEAILKRKGGEGARAGEACTSALVLVPTRELADQIHKTVETLTAFCAKDVQAVKLTDKITANVQRAMLTAKPDIVISTPARAWENVSGGALPLDKLTHLVLDEADLVLSYGYEEDLQNVARELPKGVQTILMSATLTAEVDTVKGLFCRNPALLDVDEPEAEGEGVTQYIVKTAEDEKFLLIYVIFKLKLIQGKVIIFCQDVSKPSLSFACLR
jgi:ATP-dependent RNA helicase DDX56/DBP9